MIGIYFICAIFLILLVLLCRKDKGSYILTAVFLVLQTGFSVYAFLNKGQTELDYFKFDSAGLILLLCLALLAWGSFYHSLAYLKGENLKKKKYYLAAFCGLIVSMSGAYLANDFTAMWVFVEATTLTVAALIYHDRSAASLEATWKYIFVCSVGIAIAYFGILFLSASSGPGNSFSLSFEGINERLSGSGIIYLKIAFISMLVGYSTKMGLFPMHTVAVDAHTVAPPPISALISTALMNVGFLAIFRAYSALSGTPVFQWMNHVLLLSGVLSLLVSAAYMQKVRHLKRMFAYSSLENMGIVAIGLGIGGIGAYAAFLHIVLHSFVKASLFYQVADVHHHFGTYEINKTGNYFRMNPLGAGLLLVATIGITAIPPSGMFVSEFFIFTELIKAQNWWVLIPSFLFLTFVIFAFFSRMLHLFFYPFNNDNDSSPKSSFSIPAIVMLGLVIILCFYRFPMLDSLIREAVSQIQP